jgi:predicted site-specific integrase-resolvase
VVLVRRRGTTLSLASLVTTLVLAGCGHGASTSGGDLSSASPDARVGYVRMAELVKVHPLYSQLARLDDDLQALQLRALGGNIARSGADVQHEELVLQHELDAAAAQTKIALAGKEQEYTRREQAAIAAALGAGAGASGPGGAQIASGMQAAAGLQAADVERAANQNLQTYRSELVKQDEDAVRSLQTSLSQRAAREYGARAEFLQKSEADFALQQATEDSSERLALRTKLSNLALDDAARADVKSQLDALDKKESDALGAMKNRDESTLAALRQRLHATAAFELNEQVAQIRKRTIAKINERTVDTRQSLIGQIGRIAGPGGGPVIPGGVSPDMKAKLTALHAKFQTDFNHDASKTIAQFQKTRSDLTRRFQALEGVDSDAQSGASKEMNDLQRQRGDLYNQMVAQIGREVKVLAQQRGINFVTSDVVAPAGGVDLTADAEKDIESLHE